MVAIRSLYYWLHKCTRLFFIFVNGLRRYSFALSFNIKKKGKYIGQRVVTIEHQQHAAMIDISIETALVCTSTAQETIENGYTGYDADDGGCAAAPDEML
jgi:hypothetical protein